MPAFGVYGIADARPIGEVSSTYEGRHITLAASEMKHPGAVVTKNEPVVIGAAVGIAFQTEVAGTDLITVDTEGIWIVDVYAQNDAGGSAVAGGDRLYIDITDTSCVVSKISNVATNIPFGIALGIITTPGNKERIAVKVHQDPNHLAEVFGAVTFDGAVTMDDALTVAGVTQLNNTTIITGVLYLGAGINVTGATILNSGLSVAGQVDLQIVFIHSEMHMAGILHFPDNVDATLLPAANPGGVNRLWVNAGAVVRN